MARVLNGLLLIAVLFAPASAKERKMSKAEIAAIALSPEQVASMIKVVDDPLNTVIRVDSSPVYQEKAGLLKVVNQDKFLRAFINRKTGATSIQIYMWATHGGGWQFWKRGVGESADGPVELSGTRIDGDVNSYRYGCIYTETVALDMPEALLRWAAQGAKGGVDASWRFKIYGNSVEGIESLLMKTEAAGFLVALDRVRATLQVKAVP